MFKIIVGIALLIFVTGCQVAPQKQEIVPRKVPFPEQEYAQLERVGSSTVEGQVFMTTRGGDVKYGAGREVILTPVNPYTTEAAQAIMGGRILEEADPRAKEFTHKTIADGEGRFEFKDLPAGRYYVAGSVHWQVYSGNKYIGMQDQGGVLVRIVEVGEGDTTELMLSR